MLTNPQTGIRPLWDNVSSEKPPNGTYRISYYNGVFNCSFYITISDRNITSAYDLWYFHLVGTDSANLVHEAIGATAYFAFHASIPWVNGPSWNGDSSSTARPELSSYTGTVKWEALVLITVALIIGSPFGHNFLIVKILRNK